MSDGNCLAPDGYRYGVMFNDGSVSERYNGRSQRDRAREDAARIVAEQIERTGGRHDHITLARRRPNEPWERVLDRCLHGTVETETVRCRECALERARGE